MDGGISVWATCLQSLRHRNSRSGRKRVGMDGATPRPTHRDKAAMNGAQIHLSRKDGWMEGSVCGPPAFNHYATGIRGVVENESEWTARLRGPLIAIKPR